MSAVWQLNLSSYEKMFLLALADNADNETGVCWPSTRDISTRCSMSERAVRDNINRLIDKGLLTKAIRSGDGSGRKSNVYTLQNTIFSGEIRGQSAESAGRGQSADHDMAIGRLQQCTPYNIEPSIEPSDILPDQAEEIYQLYPRHAGKGAAIPAILKALKKSEFSALKERVTLFSECVSSWPKDEKQFIPYPATWFNQERWNDDESEWKRSKKSGFRHQDKSIDLNIRYRQCKHF